MTEGREVKDVVMVGAGPSALSAAIYTTREDIETLIIEKGVIGGLAAQTDNIENYPGFPDGIEGLQLSENLRAQAEKFGAKIRLGEVSGISREGEIIRLDTDEGPVYARAALLAMGTDHKKLGIKGEQEFYGRGVHYCATCDGAFYRDKKLVVVGGGNSAAQESLFLTRYASQIEMLVRGDKMRASDVLINKLKANPKITVHLNTTTDEIMGESGQVTKVISTDKLTNKNKEFKCDGVFIFVGLHPNTGFLKNSSVELDEQGFIKTNRKLETNLQGVFASGDVRSGATMQIASATGEGATAALMMREYLEN